MSSRPGWVSTTRPALPLKRRGSQVEGRSAKCGRMTPSDIDASMPTGEGAEMMRRIRSNWAAGMRADQGVVAKVRRQRDGRALRVRSMVAAKRYSTKQ